MTDDLISRQQAIDALWAERMKHSEEMERNLETCSFALRADNKARRNRVEEDIEIIKQLPPAQPEPCEDAVSRKDCLQALSHLMDVEGFRDGWAVSRANVECMLKAMPPAQPKQRTGRWIPQDHNKRVGNISTCVYYYPTCSECGKVGIETYKYCPHCGAKMTEGDAE